MEDRNWFVYTSEIFGTKETLIACGLMQMEAKELHEEYERICERNCPDEFASYECTEYGAGPIIEKRLGII